MENITNGQVLEKLMDKTSDSLYAQIVGIIRQWIREGRLKEGDMLPSERELAKLFDVSRMPVREALKTLEFLGAVQHIRGKGVFVKKINYSRVLSDIDFVLRDPAQVLADLFDAREAIEYKAVYLAARRRTAQDLDAMDDALAEMERNISKEKDISEASLQFHAAVIAASHNPIIIQMNDLLADLLRYSRSYSLKDYIRHKSVLKAHKKIFEKIKEGDPEGAVTAMQEHLREIIAAALNR